MGEQSAIKQDERVLAGLAHGSVLLGPLTNGVGGIVSALVIWLIQRDKSAYVAFQALQALVYQVAAFVLTGLVTCLWAAVWMVMWLPAMAANPEAYKDVPPTGMWIGLALAIIPIGVWAVTMVYGLVGAARTLGGHDFQYAIIGKWLKSQR
jgi:uncharacterized Tic20 family protein